MALYIPALMGDQWEDEIVRDASELLSEVGFGPGRQPWLRLGIGLEERDAARAQEGDDLDALRRQQLAALREQYEAQGRPYYATARLWDDGVIDPRDTRDVLGLGLAAAANAPLADVRYGVFRM